MRHSLHRLSRDWEGLTAVVVGNGTSVESQDLTGLLRPDTRVLVANGGYRFFPTASVLMCSDRNWLRANPGFPSEFKGDEIIVTRPEAVANWDPRIRVMARRYIEHVRDGYFSDPLTLVEGHNSTSTNISVAVMRGAARILLLGVDLAPGPGNKRRAGEDLRDDPRTAGPRYERQVRHLTMQAAQVPVPVLNCSPRSGLTCYPYSTLEEAINA